MASRLYGREMRRRSSISSRAWRRRNPRRASSVREAFGEDRIHLARVINHVEQVELFAGGQAFAEGLLDERAQAARGVVDDVDEFLELPVHVADDVDRALGQGQSGAQAGDGGERGVGVGVLRGEGAEVDERLVVHGEPGGGRLVTHNSGQAARRPVV